MFGVACEFHTAGKHALSEAAANHLYRIAQEAVTNAVKHGKAKRIDIRLENSKGKLLLTIRDNGTGLPAVLPEKRGMGLRIMEYRAGMIDAILTAERDPAGGTIVKCSLSADAS